MNTFQIVMLVLAGLLVSSIFWEQIKSFFAKTVDTVKDKTKPKPVNKDEVTLVEVVSYWEDLKNSCEKHGLKKAVHALKSMFPLLVIQEDDDE